MNLNDTRKFLRDINLANHSSGKQVIYWNWNLVVDQVTKELESEISYWLSRFQYGFIHEYSSEEDKTQVLQCAIELTTQNIKCHLEDLMDEERYHGSTIGAPSILATHLAFKFPTQANKGELMFFLCMLAGVSLRQQGISDETINVNRKIFENVKESEYFHWTALCLSNIQFLNYLKAFNPNAPAENIKPEFNQPPEQPGAAPATIPKEPRTDLDLEEEETFTDYLTEEGKLLMPYLLKKFKTNDLASAGTKPKKAKPFSYMLFALHDLGLLVGGIKDNETQLHKAMEQTFGYFGTRSAFNANNQQLNSSERGNDSAAITQIKKALKEEKARIDNLKSEL